MIYKELYDEFLNEVYEAEYDAAPDWMKKWNDAASALEDCDPTMYRCSFSDWTDSLRDSPPVCDTCRKREVTDFDVDINDEVECEVCKGGSFVCDACDEVFDMDDANEVGEKVLCSECFDALDEEDE